jgi:predicted RNase H-like nuclease (RuvC/YqgF family)
MTTFGKSLVIFAVAVSFAFLGAAWVTLRGGPNWDAEVAALPEYTIQKDDTKWSVTDRDTGKSVPVASSTIQAAAVAAAREDLDKKQQAEIKKLKDDAEKYKKATAELRKYNEADVKALQARIQELSSQLAEVDKNILSLSNEVVKRSQDAQAIRAEAAKRREDVYRLQRELEEIRVDNFRADDLQKKLQDQLARLNGVVLALESRNKQLHSEVNANN